MQTPHSFIELLVIPLGKNLFKSIVLRSLFTVKATLCYWTTGDLTMLDSAQRDWDKTRLFS